MYPTITACLPYPDHNNKRQWFGLDSIAHRLDLLMHFRTLTAARDRRFVELFRCTAKCIHKLRSFWSLGWSDRVLGKEQGRHTRQTDRLGLQREGGEGGVTIVIINCY